MRAYLCFGVSLLAVLVSCGQAATKSKVKYIPINLEDNPPPKKILCYYNHEAYKREGELRNSFVLSWVQRKNDLF
jgi:hypothetical protein